METKENLIREKRISDILNNIEGLNNDNLANQLLEDIINDYYLNDFNGATLEDDPSDLTPLLLEKIHNVNRALRLLIKNNGLTEDNKYIVVLIKKAIKAKISLEKEPIRKKR